MATQPQPHTLAALTRAVLTRQPTLNQALLMVMVGHVAPTPKRRG